MRIRMGNLNIKQAEEKMGITGLQKFIEEKGLERITTCDKVKEVKKGFHIYDMPFCFDCSNEETALELHGFIKDLDFKNTIDVGFSY